MTDLRSDLPPMTPRIARLRRHRGYPVPWFVADVDGEPDFRVMREEALIDATRWRLCWVCGEPTGSHVAFVVGPMCAVNRTSAEPPSHKDCAVWSAQACPFLTRPHMVRREGRMPEEAQQPDGIMLARNPGVALVWVTKRHSWQIRHGYKLFNIGDPIETLWFAEGREATREEVERSIEGGLPSLREIAEKQGAHAVKRLTEQVVAAQAYLPAA